MTLLITMASFIPSISLREKRAGEHMPLRAVAILKVSKPLCLFQPTVNCVKSARFYFMDYHIFFT